MDIFAIDPSLSCTGLARLAGGLVEVERVRTVPQRPATLATTRRRIRYIVTRVLAFAPVECMTVIEEPIIVHNGGGGSQLERGALFYFLVDQLMARGPVVAVGNSARSKYATGKGGSKKSDVLAAMRARFPELTVYDDNVADALALLSMGARSQGLVIDGSLPPQHLEAVTGVVWPNPKGTK